MSDELKEQLTQELAIAFEAKLRKMGNDIKGISWFSSCAEDYNQSLSQ